MSSRICQFVSWLFSVGATSKAYLRDGSVQAVVRAATLRLQISTCKHADTGPTGPSAYPIIKDVLHDNRKSTSSEFQAIFLSFIIVGEIFAYVTVCLFVCLFLIQP